MLTCAKEMKHLNACSFRFTAATGGPILVYVCVYITRLCFKKNQKLFLKQMKKSYEDNG